MDSNQKEKTAMGNFDRARPETRHQEMPERLERLNRELAIDRVKDFEYLYATRRDHRFKIAVFRNGGNGFAATCKVGGYVHRYNGDTPSTAFIKLVKSLEWVIAKLDFERNMSNNRFMKTVSQDQRAA